MISRRRVKTMLNRSLQKYKHVVDAVFTNTVNNATNTTTIAISVDNPVIGNVTNVEARGRVKFLYMEASFQSGTLPQAFDWIVYGNPNGGIAINPQIVGTSVNKNYVFKSGHLQLDTGQTTGTVRGLIKVPSKFQRMMNGDIITFAYRSRFGVAANDNVTVKFIYKEIRG